LDDAGLLASSPRLGKVEPSLDDIPGGYRSLIVKRTYKIVYQTGGGMVYIVAVWDCRRNPAALREKVEAMGT
jgi:plasmid stabilization system protein ParE